MRIVLYHGEIVSILIDYIQSNGIKIPDNPKYKLEPDNYCEECIEFSVELLEEDD